MLTPRELASLIWLGVIVVGLVVLATRDLHFRASLLDLLRLAIRPPISVLILGFYLYVTGCVIAMGQVGAWNSGLLRDTVSWCLISGIALIFSAGNADDDPRHFRRALRQAVAATLLVEFIFGLVSFPLIIEMIAQPAFCALLLGEMLAKSDENHAPIASCFTTLLAVSGFGFLMGTLILIWAKRETIEWTAQLLTLGMLVWLPLFCLPVVYLLSWGMQYGAVIRLTKWQLEKWQSHQRGVGIKVRLAMIVGFNLDLYALGKARLSVARDLAESRDSFGDCRAAIRKFREQISADRVLSVEEFDEPVA